MSHKSPLSHRISTRIPFVNIRGHSAFRLSPEQIQTIVDEIETLDYDFIKIKPNEDGEGTEYAEDVISAFHHQYSSSTRLQQLMGWGDPPDELSYELQFFDDKLQLIFGLPTEELYSEARSIITGEYPTVDIQRHNHHYIPFAGDQYISGGELVLNNCIYHPIRPLSGPGAFDPEANPLRLITSQISSKDSVSALVQVVFHSAGPKWRKRRFGTPNATKVARAYRAGTYVDSLIDPKIEPPTDKQRRTAKFINDTEESPAFYATIRYFTFADDPEKALKHAKSIASAYRNTFQNPAISQQLTPEPYFLQREVFGGLVDSINRNHTAGKQPFTIPELASLAHIPDGDIDTPKMDWTYKALGSQLPSDAPRRIKSIDPKPFDDFLPEETTAADHLKGPAPALPPGEDPDSVPTADADAHHASPAAAPDEPANLPTTPERANQHYNTDWYSDHTAEAAARRHQRDGDLVDELLDDQQGIETRTIEQAPLSNFERANRQSEFKNRVEQYRNGDLTDEMLYDQLNENVAENLISLIQQQIEWEDTHGKINQSAPTAEDPYLPEPFDNGEGTAISPIGAEREWMYDRLIDDDRSYEVKIFDEDGDVYMGRDVRNELIDIHRDHEDAPIWLGYLKDNRYGLSPVGVDKIGWFKHMTLFGMTGTGKSTEQKNILLQYIQKGYGVCFIDPKGDAVQEFVQEIPEWRQDDIIYIKPGSKKHDRVVGLNFLETAADPDDPSFDNEVTSIVSDLTAILKGGDYWGPKMEGITTNIARAMIRSELNFTLLDMYYVLLEEESREAFADRVEAEGFSNIHQYTKRIAEMDYEEVDAVVRRIQSWVEDPIARGIVAHREGTVNITEAVDDQKIILADVSIDSADIKEVVTTAIMRRIWAAIKARDEDEAERPPFITLIDEFDDVVTAEMDMEGMLSKARSGKMGVILACQNPSQIKPESVREQMFANVRTLNSFGLGDPPDAEIVSKRLSPDLGLQQVLGLPDYNMLVRVLMSTDEGPQVSEPLPIKTFPDYPPVRTQHEADQLIEESLEKYGVPPLDEPLEEATMLIHDLGNSSRIQRHFLESVWEAHVQLEQEYISVRAINDRFKHRTNQEITDYPQGIHIPQANCEYYVIPDDDDDAAMAVDPSGEADAEGVTIAEEIISDTDVEETEATPDGGTASIEHRETDGQEVIPAKTDSSGEYVFEELSGVVKLTPNGKERILNTDDGRSRPTDRHRRLLEHGFEWMSRIDLSASIVPQESHRGVPDATATLPIDAEWDSLSDAHETWEELAEEYEHAKALTDGQNLNLEAEATVSKPARVLENLRRAKTQGRHCLFLVPDGREEGIDRRYTSIAVRIHKVLSDPPCVRNINTYEDDSGEERTTTRLYNKTEILSLTDDPRQQKFPVIQNGSDQSTVWSVTDDGVLRLFDGEHKGAKQRGVITTEELENASANAFEAWCRYDEYEDEWVVYPEHSGNKRYDSRKEMHEDWSAVREPFYPPREFGTEVSEADYTIAIIPAAEEITELGDAMPAEFTEEEVAPLFPPEDFATLDHHYITDYNPIEDTPEELETEINPTTPSSNVIDRKAVTNTESIMTSNNQHATGDADADSSDEKSLTITETIDLPSYDPNFSPRTDFGGKDPTTRSFWEAVWDSQNYNHAVALDQTVVMRGIKQGKGVPDRHVDAALEAGIETGQLISLGDDGILLAQPHQRPELILPDADLLRRRKAWEPLWEQFNYEFDEALPINLALLGAENHLPDAELDPTKDPHVKAAIHLAVEADALVKCDTDTIKLGTRGPAYPWVDIWEALRMGSNLENAQAKRAIIGAAIQLFGGDTDEWEQKITAATARNELLKGEEDTDYYVNDPRKDGNPRRKQEPTVEDLFGPDEDDDGDDGGQGATEDDAGDGGDDDAGTASATSSAADATSPDSVASAESTSAATEANATSDAPSTEAETATSSTSETTEPHDGATNTAEPDAAVDDSPSATPDTDAEPTDDDWNEDVDVDIDEQVAFKQLQEHIDFILTDAPPEGWLQALDATLDAYHDELQQTILANKQWNTLAHHAKQFCKNNAVYDGPAAGTDDAPETYVPHSPHWRVQATCTECPDAHDNAEPTDIVRIEYESCGETCSQCETDCYTHERPTAEIPSPDCDDCLQRRYCPECAAAHGLAPFEDVDVATDDPDTDTDPSARREAITREALHTDSPHDSVPGARSVVFAEYATCYLCDTDGFEATLETDDECYCEIHEYELPISYLPETPEDYFTGPHWDDSSDIDPDIATGHDSDVARLSWLNQHGRNWDAETVAETRLGWAPGTPTYDKPIVEHLLEAGYTPAQLVATGLFEPHLKRISGIFEQIDTGNSKPWSQRDLSALKARDDDALDLMALVEDEDHDLSAVDLIKPRWQGRVVFPYFITASDIETAEAMLDIFGLNVTRDEIERLLDARQEAGNEETTIPVYALSRVQKGRPHPADRQSDRKYDKIREFPHVHIKEPIWGTQTLEPNEPVVITEGVADAIAAQMHDIPVLSPVTTQFKKTHHEPLIELCELYDIPMVYVAQDNEPTTFDMIDEADLTDSLRAEVNEGLAKRERMLTSDSHDLYEEITKQLAPDDENNEDGEDNAGEADESSSVAHRDQRGPLGKIIDSAGISPGMSGAFSTQEALTNAADVDITAIHIDLPKLADRKVDLDNYLSGGLYEFQPLFTGVQVLRSVLEEADEGEILELLIESGHFGKCYIEGYELHEEQAAPEVLPDPNTVAFRLGEDVEKVPSVAACLRAGLDVLDSEGDYADADLQTLVDATQPAESPSFTFDALLGSLGRLGTPTPAVEAFNAGTSYSSLVVPLDTTLGVGLTNSQSNVEQITDPDGNERASLEYTPLFEPPTVCTIEQHEMYDLYNQSRSLATLSASPADRDFGGGDADAACSTGGKSALYDLLLRQVIGKSVGYRGKNPLRHMGKSENYFKLYDEDTAYDYKYKTLFNALLYLAVRAGIRKIRQPYGSFSDEEILYTWIEAKEGGEIPSDDPAPNRAMNAAALELGICEPSDIGEKQIGSGEDAFTLPNALSDAHYNETIRQFEGAFGVSAGRSEIVSEEQFIVDGLTTDQSAEMFGELYLTTNPPEEMCHYDTPRIPVETVWKAYKAWCELNGVEYKREYDGGKKEIASGIDGVEKKRARWKGKGIISVYNNAKLNSEGWWIYNNVE